MKNLLILMLLLGSCSPKKEEQVLLEKVDAFFEAWNRHDFTHHDFRNFYRDTVLIWHNEKTGEGIESVFNPNSNWKQWDKAWNGSYAFDSITINLEEGTITGKFHEITDFLREIGDSAGYKAIVTYWMDDDNKVKEILYDWDESNTPVSELIEPIINFALKYDSSLIKEIYLDNGFSPSTENAEKWKRILKEYRLQSIPE